MTQKLNNMEEVNNNTDKKLDLSDVMNSILNELEETKSLWIKYDNDTESYTSLDGVYGHQAKGIDVAIRIVKKYCS